MEYFENDICYCHSSSNCTYASPALYFSPPSYIFSREEYLELLKELEPEEEDHTPPGFELTCLAGPPGYGEEVGDFQERIAPLLYKKDNVDKPHPTKNDISKGNFFKRSYFKVKALYFGKHKS